MADLSYLWSNRKRLVINSVEFYRIWGKRIFSFGELIRFNNRRAKFIRKGAIIHATAEIAQASIVGDNRFLSIGAFSFVGRVSIELHCSVTIGERVCINDHVKILSASHDVLDAKWQHKRAEVVIEDFVWIGTSAIILPGVRLGRGAVVGAGAVVSKSVEPGGIVVGNPARLVSKKRGPELDYNPCEFLASNRAWLVG